MFGEDGGGDVLDGRHGGGDHGGDVRVVFLGGALGGMGCVCEDGGEPAVVRVGEV